MTRKYTIQKGTSDAQKVGLFPDFLGQKDLAFTHSFYTDTIKAAPIAANPVKDLNILFGLMYRGGPLSFDANLVYFGWARVNDNEVDLFACVSKSVTEAPKRTYLGRVSARQKILFKMQKFDQYYFEIMDVSATTDNINTGRVIASLSMPIEGISYWFGYYLAPKIVPAALGTAYFSFDTYSINSQSQVS